jgi:hypothetical protein
VVQAQVRRVGVERREALAARELSCLLRVIPGVARGRELRKHNPREGDGGRGGQERPGRGCSKGHRRQMISLRDRFVHKDERIAHPKGAPMRQGWVPGISANGRRPARRMGAAGTPTTAVALTIPRARLMLVIRPPWSRFPAAQALGGFP